MWLQRGECGFVLNFGSGERSGEPITDLATPRDVPGESRAAALGLLARMNQNHIEAHPGDSLLAARVRSYELAARMQMTVPQVIRFDEEEAMEMSRLLTRITQAISETTE